MTLWPEGTVVELIRGLGDRTRRVNLLAASKVVRGAHCVLDLLTLPGTRPPCLF